MGGIHSIAMIPLLLALVIAQAVPAPTTADGWTAAGWQALRAGATEEAANDFNQALRIDAGNALALVGAAAAANIRGRADEARQHLAAALKVQPGLTAAALLLGEILYRQGDPEGAIHLSEPGVARAHGQVQL